MTVCLLDIIENVSHSIIQSNNLAQRKYHMYSLKARYVQFADFACSKTFRTHLEIYV